MNSQQLKRLLNKEQSNQIQYSLSGQIIVITGFRDKQLQETIVSLGGTVGSGITGKTTILIAKDPSSTSGKIQKARTKGISIMSLEQFKNKYL